MQNPEYHPLAGLPVNFVQFKHVTTCFVKRTKALHLGILD